MRVDTASRDIERVRIGRAVRRSRLASSRRRQLLHRAESTRRARVAEMMDRQEGELFRQIASLPPA
jgi:hypothetical protein